MKLEGFKNEVSTLCNSALLCLRDEEYEAFCEYVQDALAGQV